MSSMKKVFLFTGVLALVFMAGAFLTSFANQDISNSIPEDVMNVFTNSCAKCHAAGGSGIAMANLNFSKWGSYDTVKKAKKATAICSAVKRDAMPPKSFLNKNPNAVLTSLQKDLVCKWSESLLQK